MAGGYGFMVRELTQAAAGISAAVDKLNGVHWQLPSGDYGADNVRRAWHFYVGDSQKSATDLARDGHDHMEGLYSNAGHYAEAEREASDSMNTVSKHFGQPNLGRVDPVGNVPAGGTIPTMPGDGHVPGRIASRLNPDQSTGE